MACHCVCVHGWPETKRVFWKVIEPLAAAGFEVIVPDLRGFGDSDARARRLPRRGQPQPRPLRARARLPRPRTRGAAGRRPRRPRHPGPGAASPRVGGPDGAVQLAAAVPEGRDGRHRGHATAVGGSRLLPAPGHRSRRSRRRARPLPSSGAATSRRSTRSRFWAHPGAFMGPGEVDFHTEPFADGAKLRASFGGYESVFDPAARAEPTLLGAERRHAHAASCSAPSDHVIYPAFDRMAAAGLPRPRRPVPAARLRSLRAVGGAARAGQRHRRLLQRPARRDADRAPAQSPMPPSTNFAQVASPTMPSAVRPRDVWKSFTTRSVPGPNRPSAVTGKPEHRQPFLDERDAVAAVAALHRLVQAHHATWRRRRSAASVRVASVRRWPEASVGGGSRCLRGWRCSRGRSAAVVVARRRSWRSTVVARTVVRGRVGSVP